MDLQSFVDEVTVADGVSPFNEATMIAPENVKLSLSRSTMSWQVSRSDTNSPMVVSKSNSRSVQNIVDRVSAPDWYDSYKSTNRSYFGRTEILTVRKPLPDVMKCTPFVRCMFSNCHCCVKFPTLACLKA